MVIEILPKLLVSLTIYPYTLSKIGFKCLKKLYIVMFISIKIKILIFTVIILFFSLSF